MLCCETKCTTVPVVQKQRHNKLSGNTADVIHVLMDSMAEICCFPNVLSVTLGRVGSFSFSSAKANYIEYLCLHRQLASNLAV